MKKTITNTTLGVVAVMLPLTAMAGGPVFTDLAAGANDAGIVGFNPAGMARLTETS